MPTRIPSFGPFSGVYVGDGPPSTAKLIQVTAKRTEGGFFDYIEPEIWVPSFGNTIPNGEQEVTFDLTFYGAGEQVMRLAMGNPLSQAHQDDPSVFAKYTLLLTDLESSKADSFLIPCCYTVKKWRMNREKRNPTKIKITFTWRERNPHIQIYKKDTLAGLLAEPEMLGRSPF
jgi:hypothetical protein